MAELLANPEQAKTLGDGARRFARERFSIRRFVHDWDRTLRSVTGQQKG
jgi:glycosyltransferase involved in cell wall biosynthesis